LAMAPVSDGENYDSRRQVCCSGVAQTKCTNDLCCGTKAYDSSVTYFSSEEVPTPAARTGPTTHVLKSAAPTDWFPRAATTTTPAAAPTPTITVPADVAGVK